MTRSHARPLLASAAILLVATVAPGEARAQDFERVVPKLPPASEVPPVPTPAEETPASTDTTVLVPELRGLVFVDSIDALQAEGIGPEPVAGGVSAPGLELLADPNFTEQVRSYLGKPLTRAGLSQITALVNELYRAAERPFVDVSVPPQNVESGVVQVVVTNYRVGTVNVEGNRYFSTPLIRRLGGLEEGETLTLPRLRESLEGYNQNPFLNVSAVIQPGAETGLSDLVLQAQDRRPLRVYAGYDNQGVRSLGRDEWYVGFNWGNVLGTGQVLSYQFTRSFTGRYTSHSLSDVIPISEKDSILLFGAYATQKPRVAVGFDSKGHSGQASIRYARTIARSAELKHGLQIGFDYKRSDNNLEFAGFRILDTAVEVAQFPFTYTLTATDPLGETTIENTFVFSPGGITEHNTDEALQQLVPFADASYVYDRFSVTRTTYLPQNFSWVVRGMAQIASDNLPYSEQLGAGGIGSVRGYDPNTALGSQGVILSTELRAPPLSVFGDAHDIEDRMQVGAFLDYADLRQKTPIPDLPRSYRLASAGISVHYTVERYLALQFEIGHQLRPAPGATSKDTQVAMLVTVSY